MPEGQSIVAPRSYCPYCKKKISWYDNFPLLSWFILRGKCRSCNIRIPISYPLIEITCCILCTTTLLIRSNNLNSSVTIIEFFAIIFLPSILLIVSIIDIDYLWIPSKLCNTLAITGLIYSLISIKNNDISNIILTFSEYILVIFASFYICKILGIISSKIIGKTALGLGDARLIATGGAWLGIKGTLVAVLIAIYSAAFFGLIGRLSGKIKPLQHFAFGPFISLGIWLSWMQGSQWWIELWNQLILN